MIALITPQEFADGTVAWITAAGKVVGAAGQFALLCVTTGIAVYAAIKSQKQDVKIDSNTDRIGAHDNQIAAIALATPSAAVLPAGSTVATMAVMEATVATVPAVSESQ